MHNDSNDTEPSPAPEHDPEVLDAAAADIDDAIASLAVTVHNLENVASLLRREAAHMRGGR
jgi:hypothetical protein